MSAGPLSPRSSKEKSIACLFIASRAAFLASLGSWLPLLSSKIAAQLGGPVAKLYVPSGGSLGLILGQGTKIPQAVGCRQIRKKKKRKKKLKSPEIKVTTSKMSINILPDISAQTKVKFFHGTKL